MEFCNLKLNHYQNPIGYRFDHLHFTWCVDIQPGEIPAECVLRVESERSGRVLLEQRLEPGATSFDASLPLEPRTRCRWTLTSGSASSAAFFETGKLEEPWSAAWLLAGEAPSAAFEKELLLEKPLRSARLYLCGYGLYEVYLDGEKIGDEYLTPGYSSYDLTNEYQTLDLTDALRGKAAARLSIPLGNGWYKGRFIFDGGCENLYGDCLKLIAELRLNYEDGTEQVIGTDESWICRTTQILANAIYDGEEQDGNRIPEDVPFRCEAVDAETSLLTERTSMPVRIVEDIPPARVLHTPAGDTILDFGQAITGWVRFFCREPNGARVRLQYAEWMQDGEFYRDNLRTARAEFVYTASGEAAWVRPHFTFYGFRYVRVEGVSELRPEDFVAARIRSDCAPNGRIVTGNEKVNRLIANAYASQQCNFLDIPTDCPQRDERMGWTGDIGIFADTACFQMDSAAFLDHFMTMIGQEQEVYHGQVPFVVPRPRPAESEAASKIFFFNIPAACAWGDAATVIPWATYEHYRDKALLRKQYPVMKAWVAYEKSRAMENKVPYLWQQDIQLGDWLALDSQDPRGFGGLTDTGFLASAYFYHSTELTRKAAEILGYGEDVHAYDSDLREIRTAFFKEFWTDDGSLAITETQTAYAVLLAFGLCPEGFEARAVERLQALLRENGGHLTTGFVGTPLLCPVLSESGAHETACELLLNEEYPGWLYEVNLGAVSIWERWNSVGPDGHITSTGMNSLNHYAYGSIVAWIYRYLCGYRPCPERPNTLVIRPGFCRSLGFLDSEYSAPWGRYCSRWEEKDGILEITVTVPAGGRALLELGDKREELLPGSYRRTLHIA